MKLRLSWRGGVGHSGIQRGSNFIKPEYIGRTFEFDENDRTKIVRFFQQVFIEREYTFRDVRGISQFLKRKFLTRAERCAVIMHLGYRYSSLPSSSNRNLRIVGCFDRRSRSKYT